MDDLTATISHHLLPYVNQPSAYVGLEINARCPDPRDAEVAIALAFPDTYALGASHLGTQVLYHALNDLPGVACDRTCCPSPDAIQRMRAEGIPLWGWESRLAVGGFDVVGFALPYELCVTNVLTMLELSHVPIRGCDRDESHPIIVAGDALADTPEPMSAFIDVFLPGDGEGPMRALATLVGECRNGPAISREQLLLRIAREVPSAYVPRFYEPTWNADGSLAALTPTRDGVPDTIPRAAIESFADTPAITAPLVPIAEAIHDRVAIEIMRGCPNGCRFCQAGHCRLPVRYRGVEEIVAIAREALANTGYDEISLLSLSTSDYPHLDTLIARLTEEFAERGVGISLPSLRVDSQLQHLPRLTSAVRKAGLTIAAEAGTDRLRRAIRKGITEQDMLDGVRAAYQAGWNKVKVYFIAGLPGETPEDIEQIHWLCRRLSNTRRDIDGQRGAISAGVSWFVPKPHTPMQYAPMQTGEYFWAVREQLIELCRKTPVNVKFHYIEQSLLEGVIARGDRRLADAIETAWRNGAMMDAWKEHFNWDRWKDAFAASGVDPAFYAHREIPTDELTPWAHIRTHRPTEFLQAEYDRMHDVLAEPAE
ncbi:MAG: TIGR03960 family B12-binding radical SAM protein [Phycisphaerae bacterium]